MIRKEVPDLVVVDLPDPLAGVRICAAIKQDPATVLLPVILVSSHFSVDDKIKGIEAGADDFLGKPVNPLELKARVASLLRIRKLTSQLDNAENVIRALVRALEGKDPYSHKHTERVATYSVLLAEASGVAGEDLRNLLMGAQVHDIGKIGIDDAVLRNPAKLEAHELRQIQMHPVIGAEICKPLAALSRVVGIVRSHHERIDGEGYPDHLQGERIPIEARIVAIADSFDAMISHRRYRQAKSVPEAAKTLQRGAGTQWDDLLVAMFLRLLNSGKIVVA